MPRIIITVPEATPQPYRFDQDSDRITLGRSPDNDILIERGSISLYHAVLVKAPGGYELRDAGSTNGLQVDGEYLDKLRLYHDDTVLLGDVLLTFHLSAVEIAALDAAPAITQFLATVPVSGEAPKLPAPTSASAPGEAARLKRHSPRRASHGPRNSSDGFVFYLCLLAALAFLAGMVGRYQHEEKKHLRGVQNHVPNRISP